MYDSGPYGGTVTLVFYSKHHNRLYHAPAVLPTASWLGKASVSISPRICSCLEPFLLWIVNGYA